MCSMELKRESGENPELPRSGIWERKLDMHWETGKPNRRILPISPKTCTRYPHFMRIHLIFAGEINENSTLFVLSRRYC